MRKVYAFILKEYLAKDDPNCGFTSVKVAHKIHEEVETFVEWTNAVLEEGVCFEFKNECIDYQAHEIVDITVSDKENFYVWHIEWDKN